VRWHSLDDAAGYSSPVAATLAGRQQIVFFTAKGLVGVDPDKGNLLWRLDWVTDYGCNIATPIVARDYLFIYSGYNVGCGVVHIATTGKTLEARLVYKNDSMHNHFSSSIRLGDHIYGFDEAELRCVDFRTGAVLWRQKGFRKGTLTIAGDRLIILGENGRLALADATPEGVEKAVCRISHAQCWVVPVLADGPLFVRDAENLICLDMR